MKIGLFAVLTDRTIRPDEFATTAEQAGFESVFLPEHTHAPVDQQTQFPLGGEIPEPYQRTLDPLVALTAAASVTTRLAIGFGVCLVLQHDLIALAKQVSTLDQLSRGRVLFGIGAGWNLDELRNHGIAAADRMGAFVERTSALRSIWADDVAECHGRWTNFGALRSWPKPVQRPHPPMLLGGSHPRSAERAARLTGHWFPNVRKLDHQRLERILVSTRAEHPELRCSVFAATPREDAIAALADLGVERCVIALPTAERDDCLRRIDRYAPLIRSFPEAAV